MGSSGREKRACSFCKEVGHTIATYLKEGAAEKRKDEIEKRNKKQGESHVQEREGRGMSCDALDLVQPPVVPGQIHSKYAQECSTVRGTLHCVVADSFLQRILHEMEKKHNQKNNQSEFRLLTENPKKKCHHVSHSVSAKKGTAGHHSGGDVLLYTYETV